MGEVHQLLTGFDRNPEAVARATGEHGDGRRWGQSLASSGARCPSGARFPPMLLVIRAAAF